MYILFKKFVCCCHIQHFSKRENTEMLFSFTVSEDDRFHVIQAPRKLPARARVKRQYIPCAYDTKALKLEVRLSFCLYFVLSTLTLILTL